MMENGVAGVCVAGDAVATRSETCYAAAVLLSDPDGGLADLPEIRRTLTWLGAQLKGQGRLYSTCDSSGFLALLAAARRRFPTEGFLRLDDGPPWTPPRLEKPSSARFPGGSPV